GLLQFVIAKNNLTTQHHIALFFFGTSVSAHPTAVLDASMMGTLAALLLAFRRILSMRSLNDLRSKVFDATLWILLASWFFPSALLALILLYLALYFYQWDHPKNWLVSLLAIAAFLVLLWGFGSEAAALGYFNGLQGEFMRPDSTQHPWFPFLFWSAFGGSAWTLFRTVQSLKSGLSGRLLSLRLVFVFWGIGFLWVGLHVHAHSSVWLLAFVPASVLAAAAWETLPKFWMKEAMLWAGMAASIGAWISGVMQAV
ncbi:MAG: DUF6427 family protein, partial [Flavobacteriaceae bacterium]